MSAGAALSDTITVLSEDGSDSQVITITITGANDGASITGDVTGAVTEDGFGEFETITTGGTLTVSDPDTGEAELQPVAAGTAGDNGYGTFEVLADGTWTYTLNNEHAAVQALSAGAALSDTITVLSEDGSDSQVITITITGANDGASITGDVTGAVTEDGFGEFETITTGGTLTVSRSRHGRGRASAGCGGYGGRQWLWHV